MERRFQFCYVGSFPTRPVSQVWWSVLRVRSPALEYGRINRLVQNGRSDLLMGSGSRLDIENINLLATLLVHTQYQGCNRASKSASGSLNKRSKCFKFL